MSKSPTLNIEERLKDCCEDIAAVDAVTTETAVKVDNQGRRLGKLEEWRKTKVDAELEKLNRWVKELMRKTPQR